MTNSDFFGLAASYAYATILLVVGSALRRLFGQKPELTRKITRALGWAALCCGFAVFVGDND